jgi:hypothetical protein
MAVKTITVKGDPVRFERAANAAITPGHLIELISTNKVQKQAGDSTRFAAMFALENSLIGDEIGTDYAAAQQVQCGHFRPGDEVYAWLSDGENVVIGDELMAGTTDGELVKHTGTNVAIAIAKEAVDLSASSNSAKGRITAIII